jgi:hypothetical protein
LDILLCHFERSEESIRLSAGDGRSGFFAALLMNRPGLPRGSTSEI